MRLRKIRLSGFKSFVDPTTIELPGSIVGVVGPNGCGKSNVIDAVRWVMGEVSARSLRGDTMADVVFNGSRSRKPVSRASVELVFDNLDRRAGGRFAAYSEISVRRQMVREGQSTYWLNGARCRRRDVMDVFHGTGLGPRSYAIVEQGTISRIIEAKPQDLRDVLEEAAGISMYKERRRETENRIRHTLENLDRLNDLRGELGRRLAHLKRQATLAEKFRELKAAQRELEGEHLALQWRAHDEEAARNAKHVASQQSRVDAALAAQRRIEAGIEKARAAHAEAADAYNRSYRDVIDAGAAIARIEESMQSIRRRRDELAGALREETERIDAARRQVQAERRQREELAAQLAAQEPALAQLQAQAQTAHRDLGRVETEVNELQAELDASIEREREPARAVHAEQIRMQHLESSVEELDSRARTLESERDAIDLDSLERETAPVRSRLQSKERELEAAAAERARAHDAVQRLRQDVHGAESALHDAREALGRGRGRVASLEALQQEALGAGAGAFAEWIEARGFADAPRLAQEMRVAEGWEHAVEAVLGVRLQAVRADAFRNVAVDAAETLEQGTLTAIDSQAVDPGAIEPGAIEPGAIKPGAIEPGAIKPGAIEPGAIKPGAIDPGAADQTAIDRSEGLATLRSKVETSWPIAGLLDGVLCAASLEEGLAARSRLALRESVVTAQGVWIGPTWLHIRRGGTEQHGVLARERVLKELAQEIERMSEEESARAHAVHELSAQLRAAEEAHAAAQRKLNEGHREYAVMRSDVAARTAEADRASLRSAELDTELAETVARAGAARESIESARARLERSSHELSRLTAQRTQCEERRRERREHLSLARERWRKTRDDTHALELRVQGMRSRIGASQEASERDRRRLEELEQRMQAIEDALGETEAPLAQSAAELDQKLAHRSSLEAVMRAARGDVERLEGEVRRIDEDRHRRTAEVQQEREELERLRVESQKTLVVRKGVEERLEAAGQVLDALLARVGVDADPHAWAEKLEAMERRIARLGPINLAAIEEHEQQAERKRYLDSQHADLEEALATLDTAIQKIDRETRTRFRETYERVNHGLGTMFPRLFAGGSASLHLTSEDLLGAGVTVMARPPGKRNTNIHLLSGGEKALTAIALVFAIFELNPAPFCLLDEVDAPLDDVNVGRFRELVEEMAKRVQLVLVTHNKNTMEIAAQLIGITMHEPGVSRLVAVDVEEAVEMVRA